MPIVQFEGKQVIYGESVGNNTRLGEHTFENIKAGAENNTAIGWNCLLNLTTGTSNTGVGQEALQSVQAGKDNVGIGKGALNELTEGKQNVAVGDNTGKEITTGINNVFVGYHAGEGTPGESSSNTCLGAFTLSNTEGEKSENLAWGEAAGGNLVTGSKNIFIGNKVGESGSYSSRLYIGSGSGGEPLIKGDFSAKTLTVNGTLAVPANSLAEGAIKGSKAFAFFQC